MNRLGYDVVIAGARCAGATLGIYLARAGASVLLLDKDTLPSDQILSTHTIHPPGIDVLDEVGVGEAVRQVAPPMRIVRLNKNGAMLDLEYANGRAEYCPRRKRLDGLLQEAAVRAGAELHDRTRVTSVVWENGRAAGVRAEHQGKEEVFRARLVVGADGRHSTVAKMAGAEEYLGYDAPRAIYWAYWPAPTFWASDPAYRFGMYIGKTRGDIRAIFHTDNDQLLIGSLPPTTMTGPWKANPRATLTADLASDPVTGPLIRGSEPDGQVRGTVRERYFFRAGAGPGWALAGDAGHHKEFVIGDGITEALLQARNLSAAILEGGDGALVRWWRRRDVEALPLFFFGQDEGSLGPPKRLESIVFSHISKEPQLRDKMARVMEHEVSPYGIFPISQIVRWTVAAGLRGELRVIAEFLAMGRRVSAFERELKYRQTLLAEPEDSAA